jgi:hypothetical protein
VRGFGQADRVRHRRCPAAGRRDYRVVGSSVANSWLRRSRRPRQTAHQRGLAGVRVPGDAIAGCWALAARALRVARARITLTSRRVSRSPADVLPVGSASSRRGPGCQYRRRAGSSPAPAAEARQGVAELRDSTCALPSPGCGRATRCRGSRPSVDQRRAAPRAPAGVRASSSSKTTSSAPVVCWQLVEFLDLPFRSELRVRFAPALDDLPDGLGAGGSASAAGSSSRPRRCRGRSTRIAFSCWMRPPRGDDRRFTMRASLRSGIGSAHRQAASPRLARSARPSRRSPRSVRRWSAAGIVRAAGNSRARAETTIAPAGTLPRCSMGSAPEESSPGVGGQHDAPRRARRAPTCTPRRRCSATR